MLSLYSHAYQSYIWNRVVSERVLRFGSKSPLVGDIVLVDNDKKKSNWTSNNVGRRDFNDVSFCLFIYKDCLFTFAVAQGALYPQRRRFREILN